ncbi:UDP-N-acetylmuramate dehydrogenase [Granulicatella balaenopterae]|uniref:UDP-N-acetylenolpyruvoylglucosamine reductase n=1 Tax=Granulicatella balaenopterae TaxID=137733 RepID=A0A1H9L4B2_9LACT|nr:UDP-N-acetylmuramate dehydrogenase [Granulicatella balaenopterae]SER06089.1 UDP-N-acetylmuramate dehydrogenase [Granulicatella balaenopterae]
MKKDLLLAKFPEVKILFEEPLSKYTYTKTGGKAEWLVFPKSNEEAKEIVNWLKEEKVPMTILGNASNVIVRDGGIQGAVILLSEMNDIIVKENRIIAQAGALLVDTSATARDAQLTGLEFACGIPGSIGGAVFMNAGAYGGEVDHVIEYVDVLTCEGEFKRYYHDELAFSYRHSLIQETNDIVLAACFNLTRGDKKEISARMDELTEMRESKQPLEYPSCGSVFKRPEGYYTGKLIQDAGLQGKQIGGAQVSTKHAGFIVNVDHATASDYLALIHYVQEQIWDINQVALETEVRIIGED